MMSTLEAKTEKEHSNYCNSIFLRYKEAVAADKAAMDEAMKKQKLQMAAYMFSSDKKGLLGTILVAVGALLIVTG